MLNNRHQQRGTLVDRRGAAVKYAVSFAVDSLEQRTLLSAGSSETAASAIRAAMAAILDSAPALNQAVAGDVSGLMTRGVRPMQWRGHTALVQQGNWLVHVSHKTTGGNLDGQVTPKDYAVVDGNVGLGPDWASGDLNGDGKVNPADYAQIDGNMGAGIGGDAGPRLDAVWSPAEVGSAASNLPTGSDLTLPAGVVASTQSVFSNRRIIDEESFASASRADVLR